MYIGWKAVYIKMRFHVHRVEAVYIKTGFHVHRSNLFDFDFVCVKLVFIRKKCEYCT